MFVFSKLSNRFFSSYMALTTSRGVVSSSWLVIPGTRLVRGIRGEIDRVIYYSILSVGLWGDYACIYGLIHVQSI